MFRAPASNLIESVVENLMTPDECGAAALPKRTPEIAAAALIVSKSEWFRMRQDKDHNGGILVRTPESANVMWLLRGLQHDFREATRQLTIARIGEGKWKEMKADLLSAEPGARVCPLDYCPEINPEDIPIFKDEDRMDEVPDLPCFASAMEFADMLRVGEAEVVFDYDRTDVEQMLNLLAGQVADLTKVREALRLALPER